MAGANYPKGNNSNNAARTDVDDTSCSWTSSGYNFCGLTGSASTFAKSTHNGQNSGIADLNGNVWEVTPGFTSNGSHFLIFKEAASIVDVTGGTTLSTDLWSAAGYSDLHDNLGATYESAIARSAVTRYASASQAFSAATEGNAWAFAGMGGMLAAGASTAGTAEFGSDGFGITGLRPCADFGRELEHRGERGGLGVELRRCPGQLVCPRWGPGRLLLGWPER